VLVVRPAAVAQSVEHWAADEIESLGSGTVWEREVILRARVN